MNRKLASIVLVSVVLSGCAAGAAPSPASSVATSAAPGATASVTASSVAGMPCTMGPLAHEADWKPLKPADGKFALLYPGEWEDLSGQVDFSLASLIDAATFAELGVPQDATAQASFVRAPAGLPNVSVFAFEPVHSSTAEIYARQQARIESFPVVREMLATNVDGCMGGEPAKGLAFTFDSEGQEVFQKNLYAVRDKTMFTIQFLAASSEDAALLDDILTTWGWTLPPLAP